MFYFLMMRFEDGYDDDDYEEELTSEGARVETTGTDSQFEQ